MCDEETVKDNEAYLSRRQVTLAGSAAMIMATLPRSANAMDVTETDVTITTPDGDADAYFVHPSSGSHPGILIWPDILGLRPAFQQMGKRLAEAGYSVLVINPYYREATSPVVSEGASFQDEETRNHVLPMALALSAETVITDAKAFVSFLDAQTAVDSAKQIGTTGYCMGGPFTMITAATLPDRVGAGASFHGGRLVLDTPDSPHLLVPQMKADFLFAIAENDDEKQPEAKSALRAAFDNAGLKAEIEVYEGALHGWCPPDSRVYNEAQAERAWARMLVLFQGALA
ncbi:MAG: dienelactone hydrolase family protein [Rhodobiaceae bacterium]|nr:dienelactone hydrolase family protein [Rhodobiaceae bacterium]